MSESADKPQGKRDLVLPDWLDNVFRLASAGGAFGAVYVVLLFTYGASPENLNRNYMPDQPIPYDHSLHAGELGIDCRYCHTAVEDSSKAAVPPTSTCMNCHAKVRTDSALLQPLRDSFATGNPVNWVKIHDLPDYVYFNHSAHVTRGVGCATCHGRVDRMETVFQDQSLSMGWCLDCHRNPFPNIRPLSEITNMDYQPTEKEGRELLRARGWDTDQDVSTKIRELTSCSTCHR